jgi:hypothetical protein
MRPMELPAIRDLQIVKVTFHSDLHIACIAPPIERTTERSACPSRGRSRRRPALGCASLRRDDLAGHCRKLNDLDGCKKSLRERRKDDLDDLDDLLSRLLLALTIAAARVPAGQLPVSSPHPAASREMAIPGRLGRPPSCQKRIAGGSS